MHFRQPSSTSSFESFVSKSNEPIPKALRLYHTDFSPSLPANLLLSILSNSSILTLRRVSRTTKSWTESRGTSPFASLHIQFPNLDLYSSTTTTLHRIFRQCQKLTVSVLGSEFPLVTFHNLPEQRKIPAFPRLTHLHIIPPDTDSFEPLLAFRLFLQSAEVPLLSRITIDGLALEGIRALRWGPFSSYVETDWRGAMVWRRINVLEVRLLPWWSNQPRFPTGNKAQGGIEVERQQMEKLEERAGIKILHDWVKSFEDNKMERFRFEWPAQIRGYNPLLLGESAAKDRSGSWFSAPPIRSRGCREVWLGGCHIGMEDVRLLEGRLRGLERVMVWRGWLGEGLVGKRSTVEGRDWVGVHLEPTKTSTKESSAGHTHAGKPAIEKRALDDGTRRAKGLEEMDDETEFSDTSMDVPIFFDF